MKHGVGMCFISGEVFHRQRLGNWSEFKK
jgi:hypothetical protein